MPKLTAKEIVELEGMCPNPEYYRGRCATTSDLDGGILFNFYLTIKKELGDGPAEAFSLMVQNVKQLSAQKFLKSLYALEENGWEYLSEVQKKINEAQEDYGTMRVIYEYHMSKRDDTAYIRNSFLSNIRKNKYSRFESYMRYRSEEVDFLDDDDDTDDDDCEVYD